MDKNNLKEIFWRLRHTLDELESEIFSDPKSYVTKNEKIKITISDDDDGYPD